MSTPAITELALIAGKGSYPLLLAQSARRQGVTRLVAVAFRGETERSLAKLVDEIHWIYLGQLGRALDVLKATGIRQAVMAGQITPTYLFNLRMDAALLAFLARLRERNAHTIFGAAAQELQAIGVELLPAHQFMEHAMPAPGLLSRRAPTAAEEADIRLGLRVAKVTSGLEIGQTVVVKDGVILAVEALEGTDQAILRGGKIGGPGVVVVKVAKEGHDMRFDIPVIGTRTMKVIKKVKASVLALQAGKAIILERDQVVRAANALGVCLLVAERT